MLAKIKDIDYGERIPFLWRSNTYGWAYFDLCPIYRKGYLKEIYIVSAQQITSSYPPCWYRLKISKAAKIKEFDVSERMQHIKNIYQLDVMEEPYLLTNFWCFEHQTICQKWRVPANSSSFHFELYSWKVGLIFE